MDVHSSSIHHNSPKLEKKLKCGICYCYWQGILTRKKQKTNKKVTDTHNNMGESQKHCAKGKRLDTKSTHYISQLKWSYRKDKSNL